MGCLRATSLREGTKKLEPGSGISIHDATHKGGGSGEKSPESRRSFRVETQNRLGKETRRLKPKTTKDQFVDWQKGIGGKGKSCLKPGTASSKKPKRRDVR